MSDAPRLRAVEDGARDEAPPPSDAAVIEGLLASEPWAAEELYSRVHTIVERTVRRILQANSSDCEDVIQAAFEQIVRSLIEKRFHASCRLTTWAAAIASNVTIDLVRARVRERNVFARHETDGADFAAPWAARLERQIEARAELERLHGILSRIPERQAKIVILHDVLGHDIAEIAVLMRMSTAATQSNLVRGRSQMLRRARATFGAPK